LRQRLTAVGNGFGIVIEPPMLERLGIDRETELEVSTDGTRLIIEPVPTHRHERVQASAEKVMKAHEATLRKLAK